MAYAPASRFKVGAAIVADSGKTYTGCNIENVSYGLSLCAERVALYKAVSEGERGFSELVIVGSGGKQDAAPCGACRQALLEFSDDLLVTYMYRGEFVSKRLTELVPDPFRGKGGADDRPRAQK